MTEPPVDPPAEPRPLPPFRHGLKAYRRGWCKCPEICLAAFRTYSREYRLRRGIKPIPHYTPEEVAILRSDLPRGEAAEKLGRSKDAVDRARRRLGISTPRPRPQARVNRPNGTFYRLRGGEFAFITDDVDEDGDEVTHIYVMRTHDVDLARQVAREITEAPLLEPRLSWLSRVPNKRPPVWQYDDAQGMPCVIFTEGPQF